ncbi:hypothetical protein [Rubellimicrobium arenae]|uniref:hypothetical protein n=1 Tax=Rubellimicrobium arenae TaxID=2817372 RepID=UPI001B303082|nr:hypothetical protein [Rubellimicrobium arenae]
MARVLKFLTFEGTNSAQVEPSRECGANLGEPVADCMACQINFGGRVYAPQPSECRRRCRFRTSRRIGARQFCARSKDDASDHLNAQPEAMIWHCRCPHGTAEVPRVESPFHAHIANEDTAVKLT